MGLLDIVGEILPRDCTYFEHIPATLHNGTILMLYACLSLWFQVVRHLCGTHRDHDCAAGAWQHFRHRFRPTRPLEAQHVPHRLRYAHMKHLLGLVFFIRFWRDEIRLMLSKVNLRRYTHCSSTRMPRCSKHHTHHCVDPCRHNPRRCILHRQAWLSLPYTS